MIKAPQLVVDSTSPWESFLVNQPEPEPSRAPYEQDHPFSSSTPMIKEENPKQETPSDVTDNMKTNLWSNLKDFEPTMLPSSTKMASDNADTVYSCTGSHSTLEMDFGVDSVFGTDSDFHFDESQFI
ncbi:hypothetical protein L6164_029830 [Bauhinia variegata]|nr:hypothetical protein L6164_029830 [Bauhinia variegata]